MCRYYRLHDSDKTIKGGAICTNRSELEKYNKFLLTLYKKYFIFLMHTENNILWGIENYIPYAIP